MAKLETRERIGRERGSAGINPNPPLISTLEHTTSGEPKHQKLSTKRKKESAAVDNYIHTKLAFARKCYNVSENVQFSARSQHSGVRGSAKGVQQVGAECGGAISKPVQLLPKVPDCRSCRCIVPQRGTRVPAATVLFRLHAKIYSIISGCIRFVCCINFFLFC